MNKYTKIGYKIDLFIISLLGVVAVSICASYYEYWIVCIMTALVTARYIVGLKEFMQDRKNDSGNLKN